MGDVEKTYQKKTQKEHILLRPDSYVGSIDRDQKAFWVLNKEETAFEKKEISYVPGLYKIFDEILVNAADNVQRSLTASSSSAGNSVSFIKVEIDPSKGYISVSNDGPGIPVETHREHNCSVAELIFGHLLTGSNFDDNQRKVTGGRNGFGAKLANLFSKKFCVDIGDSKRKKRAKLVWRNNMEKESEEILEYAGKDYVRVMFWPDFARFGGMKGLEEDTVRLFRKRVWDLAGIMDKKVSVFCDNKKVPIKDFKSYCSLYMSDAAKLVYHREDRWEIGVAISDGEFSQVSFVNSIATTRGGPHVELVISSLYSGVADELQKKLKKTPLKPSLVRPHLMVFVNCLIENPSFDSQTKEALTTKNTQFGSKVTISDKFCKDVLKSGLTDAVVQQAQVKEQLQLQKTLKGTKATRLLGITKLEDANRAGTSEAHRCTLILTEGDSAKALAMAGLEVIGRDYYGVYPLRGKFLNVREAAVATLLKNQEVAQLIEILGLSVGKSYGGKTNALRYGSLMVMADQDHDGSHIKGLVINFIHHFWPDLLQGNAFLKEFITPIVKASKGLQVTPFFTMRDYKMWMESIGHPQSYRIKYYKGLGTSTDKEAREYFSNLREHVIRFVYKDRKDDEAVDLAFNKKKADERKDWLAGFDPAVNVDHSVKQLGYYDFVHKELIQFSVANNQRAIPSLCDGLKTGQRKILFSCFKKRLNGEIKVAQLSGYVAEHSEYHHGEQNLADTIVGMAQSFVGKNNLNLLQPIGQFGSRAVGGKDAASARYIHTALSKIARALFPEGDDHVLTYVEEDGHRVEPVYYVPVIPLALANGSEGIGSGWSTFIPNYSPRELIANIRRKLKGGVFKRMIPWYRGFLGEISPSGDKGFQVKGIYRIQGRTLDILELPLQKWTRDYKAFLEAMMANGDSAIKIDDIREFHTTRKVHFRIDFKGNLPETEELEKILKLQGSISCANMVLFDTQGRIKRYNNELEILDEYFKARLALYSKRKAFMLGRLNRDKTELSNQVEFIRQVSEGRLKLHGLGKKELSKMLLEKGFVPKSKFPKVQSELEADQHEEPVVEERDRSADKKGEKKSLEIDNKTPSELYDFNYLLSMPIYSLTSERRQQIEKHLARVNEEIKELQSSTPEDLWNTDLEYLLEVIDEIDRDDEKEAAAQEKQIKKPSGFVDPEPAPRDKATIEALIAKLPESFRGGLGDDTSDGMEGEREKPKAKVARITGKKNVAGKAVSSGKSASKDKAAAGGTKGSASGRPTSAQPSARPGQSSSSQTAAAAGLVSGKMPSSTFDMSKFVTKGPSAAVVQQAVAAPPKAKQGGSEPAKPQPSMTIMLSDEDEEVNLEEGDEEFDGEEEVEYDEESN